MEKATLDRQTPTAPKNRAKQRFLHRACQQSVPCKHCVFKLLTSRAVMKEYGTVLSHQVCGVLLLQTWKPENITLILIANQYIVVDHSIYRYRVWVRMLFSDVLFYVIEYHIICG